MRGVRGLFAVLAVIIVTVGLSSTVGELTKAAPSAASGCAGPWLATLTVDGRSGTERLLLAFATDGTLVVYRPPAIEPLLATDAALSEFASTGLGSWTGASGTGCAFQFFSLLGDANGNELGALDMTGALRVDPAKGAISGAVKVTQSAPTGKTYAAVTGRLDGVAISPSVVSATPAANS